MFKSGGHVTVVKFTALLTVAELVSRVRWDTGLAMLVANVLNGFPIRISSIDKAFVRDLKVAAERRSRDDISEGQALGLHFATHAPAPYNHVYCLDQESAGQGNRCLHSHADTTSHGLVETGA